MFLAMLCHESGAAITVNELVVKIKDAATGKPMAGVHVDRSIMTQYAPLFFFPIEVRQISHPNDYAITNNDGVAVFPPKKLPRKSFNEGICKLQLEVNFDSDRKDKNDAGEYILSSEFSKNGINDALSLVFTTSVDQRNHYQVVKSANPRREYVIFKFGIDFRKPPKAIVIKLGNISLVENGIKTEVTFEEGEEQPKGLIRVLQQNQPTEPTATGTRQ